MNGSWKVDGTSWSDRDFQQLKVSGDNDVIKFCGERHTPSDWLERGKCILVGGKGLGKSFLLAYRSHHHRRSANRTLFHPYGGHEKRLVEKLTDLAGALPDKHWMNNKGAVESWAKCWQIALLGYLAWYMGISTAGLNKYSETFPEHNDLPRIRTEEKQDAIENGPLQWFLAHVLKSLPPDKDDCEDFLKQLNYASSIEWCNAIKKSLRDSAKDRIAIYLDNPDELVSRQQEIVWRNIQQGLMLAIWKLKKGGGLAEELLIYASIRGEALDGTVSSDLAQAMDLTIHLRYTKTMLENIFKNLVSLTEPEKLHSPDLIHQDPIVAFFGQSQVSHNDRLDSNGMPRTEGILEACIRHTRMIPRELVQIGAAVSRIAPSERSVDKIKFTVNSTATKIIEYAKANCFPPWTPSLENMSLRIESSVINKEDLSLLTLDPGGEEVRRNHFKLLLSMGLLGYAESRPLVHRNYFIQRFSFDEVSGYSTASQFDSSWYFVHPAFKEWIKTNKPVGGWLPDSRVIIGNELSFEACPPRIRLAISNDKLIIHINGIQLLTTLGGDRGSDPFRFLFSSLYAHKLKGGIFPTFSDVNEVTKKLKKLFPNVYFPVQAGGIKGIGQVRDWAKKINKNNTLKKEFGAIHNSSDRRNKGGFVTISVPSKLGADGIVQFNSIKADEIHSDFTQLA